MAEETLQSYFERELARIIRKTPRFENCEIIFVEGEICNEEKEYQKVSKGA